MVAPVKVKTRKAGLAKHSQNSLLTNYTRANTFTPMPAPPSSTPNGSKQKNRIGENIRASREAKTMTQLALAHAIGWKGPDAGAQISRFESGDKEPRISTLQRIAFVLGVTLESLLSSPPVLVSK